MIEWIYMIQVLMLVEIMGSLEVDFAIDGGFGVEFFQFLHLPGVEEEIIVLFQKLEHLICNKYYATIYGIPMHLVGKVEPFALHSRQFLIPFILGLLAEHTRTHAFLILCFLLFFISHYSPT